MRLLPFRYDSTVTRVAALLIGSFFASACSAPALDLDGKVCGLSDPCPAPYGCVHRQGEADRCRNFPGAQQEGIGLLGTYFHGDRLEARAFERIDAEIRFEWGAGAPEPSLPSDNFSVRWTGFMLTDAGGVYTFHTLANDGVRLTVDGTKVIERWTDAIREDQGTLTLEAARRYPISLEYYEGENTASVSLSWTAPGQVREVIPSRVLYPPEPQTQ